MKIPRGLRALRGALALLAFASGPSSSQLLGPEFQVNSYTTSHQQFPAVAADAAGNFVVVWASQGQEAPDFAWVFGQRYDAAGAPLGGEFRANTFTAFGQRNPAIAANDAGEFLVTWHSYAQDGSLDSVIGQRYSAAGSKAAGEFQLNSYTTDRQMLSTVAAEEEGRFVVAWPARFRIQVQFQ